MNKAIQKRWAKALRSGTYQQGYGSLKRGGQYCCLGVLREIADTGGCGLGMLKIDELKSVGMALGDALNFADLNDKDRLTFEEIAYYVDAL